MLKYLRKVKRFWRNYLQINRMFDDHRRHMDVSLKEIRNYNIQQQYESLFLTGKDKGITDLQYGEEQLIVSLTSYGQRIHKVHLTIESIMRQTLKPNKIILWLDENEFSDETIPTSLKMLRQRGLEVKYTEDIKSFKKLIPTLSLFPTDNIITIDDDCIYPPNLTDVLFSQHKKNPTDIICSHAHIIDFYPNGQLKPYIEWNDPPKNVSRASLSFLPVGFGGIFYPPHSLHPDVFRKDLFMSLCPAADDMWFKIMAIKNNVTCRTAPIYEDIHDWITSTNGKYDHMLYTGNAQFNNTQLENIMKHYNLTWQSFNATGLTEERLIPELYQETEEQWILYLKHKFAYELTKSHIKKGDSVLEIGCGDGYGAYILSETGAKITAIDIDIDTINNAKRKYTKDNLEFLNYNGSQIDLPPHSYDVVISFQVIEHVSNLEIYFNNIKQLVNEHGLILITTPNRTYRLSTEQKPWNPYHITEYNEKSIKEVLSKHLPQFQLYAITADPEILNIEKERCRRNRDDYDANEFQYVFKRSNYTDVFSTRDFYITNKDIDTGLDILVSNMQLN